MTPKTPLPWTAEPDDGIEGPDWCIVSDAEGHEPTVACMLQPSDAKYIVHAANSLPQLQERVRELEALLDRASDMLTDGESPCYCEPSGHKPDCKLDKWLREVAAALEPKP